MKLFTVDESWRGIEESLAVALLVCAAFAAGDAFNRLQENPRGTEARKNLLYRDFGEVGKYRSENLALSPDPRRVIFFGDSITYRWDLKTAFPGEAYLNRGIGGQTTSQMLVRFRQDVLNLQPASVVILGGANDLGDSSAAPSTIPDIESNLQTMAELAVDHHIRPIFASLLPVHNYASSLPISATRSPQTLLAINSWLQSYCADRGYTYINFHDAMVSPDGKMRRELSDDGLHPNAAGYEIMTSVARSALETKATAP